MAAADTAVDHTAFEGSSTTVKQHGAAFRRMRTTAGEVERLDRSPEAAADEARKADERERH